MFHAVPGGTALASRIGSPGPKRILSLDGGGIRGVLTLEILARIEALLRASTGNPTLRLGDWFDFIGGASTGAIIASGLALGMEVEKLLRFYCETGQKMFRRAGLVERLWYLYDSSALADELQRVFGEETELGSERVRTLLLLTMRNASTGSTWPVWNNPHARYNQTNRANCNLRLPLWQLARASAAAPVYFPAERIRVGASKFLFQDGGVTPYNNPAFLLFLLATAEPYAVNWAATADDLLLVSVGTGGAAEARADLEVFDLDVANVLTKLPGAIIREVQKQQDLLCRLFGECRRGMPLDRDAGDLIGAPAPGGRKLFSYVRYDAELTPTGLAALGLPHVSARAIRRMDSSRHIAELRDVGRRVAETQVLLEHFTGF